MLSESKARGCYSKLVQANLMEPLPFDKDRFDAIICTGVTTYLGELYVSEHSIFKFKALLTLLTRL
jgi:predicted TPR repeat methyltransferase